MGEDTSRKTAIGFDGRINKPRAKMIGEGINPVEEVLSTNGPISGLMLE
jgi:hypothetical protein